MLIESSNMWFIKQASSSSAIESRLSSLPPELQLEIFERLHAVSSACLGLTCKKFYAIHWNIHGKVQIFDMEPLTPELRTRKHEFSVPGDRIFERGYFRLHHILDPWMLRAGYVRDRRYGYRFVKARRLEGMKRYLEDSAGLYPRWWKGAVLGNDHFG